MVLAREEATLSSCGLPLSGGSHYGGQGRFHGSGTEAFLCLGAWYGRRQWWFFMLRCMTPSFSCRAGKIEVPSRQLRCTRVPFPLVTGVRWQDGWQAPFSALVHGRRNTDQAVARPLFLAGDLEVVLVALCRPPFEPLESVGLEAGSLETVRLLVMSVARWVSGCTRSWRARTAGGSPATAGVLFKPRLAFVPENMVVAHTPVESVAFHPPSFD